MNLVTGEEAELAAHSKVGIDKSGGQGARVVEDAYDDCNLGPDGVQE
jgi:hypothetical protein